MRRQLEYKQLWRGGQVLAVPPAYTSQRCAYCGHTAKENRLSQSKFRCQVCGYTANADVNGARNILAAGARRSCLWRDGAVRPPVEAGTHRNDSGDSLNVAGILVLQGVEDVNKQVELTPRPGFLTLPTARDTGCQVNWFAGTQPLVAISDASLPPISCRIHSCAASGDRTSGRRS